MTEKTLAEVKNMIVELSIVVDYLDKLKCNAKFTGDNVTLPLSILSYIIRSREEIGRRRLE